MTNIPGSNSNASPTFLFQSARSIQIIGKGTHRIAASVITLQTVVT